MDIHSTRRAVLALAGLLALGAGAPAAAQAGFPSKPVRIVVPFSPGGSNDVLGRLLAERLGAMWGQTVVVENKPGAGGNVGGEMVAKGEADGHTLLVAPDNLLSINAHLFARMPFDPAKDLAPVSLLGTLPVVLVVRPNLGAATAQELLALAKSRPGSLSFASGGVGTPQHLAGEMFKSLTGTKMVHVPYKGNVPAITDLLGGQVDLLFSPVNSVLPHIRSGRLKALAVASGQRAAALPEVPTLAEAGLPAYEGNIWISLVAPARTPKDVVERVSADVARVMAQPEVRARLAEQGIQAQASTPAELAALAAGESQRWGRLIREAGLRVE